MAIPDSSQPAEETPDRRSGRTERRKGKDRRGTTDRRAGYDQRAGKDRRSGEGRRGNDSDISEHRKVERRINEHPMTAEELEFIRAINDYKQQYNKPFPTWSEILHIVKSMGYSRG